MFRRVLGAISASTARPCPCCRDLAVMTMNHLMMTIALGVVAACHRGATHDCTSLEAPLTHAVEAEATKGPPEVAAAFLRIATPLANAAVERCRADAWSEEVIDCVASATKIEHLKGC